MNFNSFFIGFMVGLICLSALLAHQYGFTYQIIQTGYWSVAYCLKPHTLILYPVFDILYYLLLGDCKYRELKTIALLFLGFVIQDSAYMYFYCPVYSTSATLRNGFIFYFSLFFLNKAGQELNRKRVILSSLISLVVLFVFVKSVSLAPDRTYFVVVDSLLKIIPLVALLPSFRHIKK